MNIDDLLNKKADTFEDEFDEIIDIRVMKRNKRKCITIIQNLILEDSERKTFMKYLKKTLSCNASYDNETNEIHLQGDHKDELPDILKKKLEINKECIRIH